MSEYEGVVGGGVCVSLGGLGGFWGFWGWDGVLQSRRRHGGRRGLVGVVSLALVGVGRRVKGTNIGRVTRPRRKLNLSLQPSGSVAHRACSEIFRAALFYLITFVN